MYNTDTVGHVPHDEERIKTVDRWQSVDFVGGASEAVVSPSQQGSLLSSSSASSSSFDSGVTFLVAQTVVYVLPYTKLLDGIGVCVCVCVG